MNVESFVIDSRDNTVRQKNGNVVAACGDQNTAALLAIVLERFQGDKKIEFPVWKGPYAS